MLSAATAFGQDTAITRKPSIPRLKVNNEHFDRIFGSHCPDSLTNPLDRKRTYVLTPGHKGTVITAYKSGKKKWAYQISDLLQAGDNTLNIDCVDFYQPDKKLVMRLFLDNYISLGTRRIYHIDIDPENGKLIDKALKPGSAQ